MKKQSILYGIILLLAILVACNQEKSDEEKAESLQEKVEEVHDVAMAKIGSIRHFQDTLDVLIKKMATDTTQIDSTMLEELKNGRRMLIRADDQMMEWMRNYKSNNEEMPIEDRLKYLKSEEKKVIAVQDSINKSLERASAIIEKVD